ncbi:uncharacterized protein LOC141653742 [Silene latifolia]|uniref:uncharacterized protein LOC141653742 n=1 Tax=Silene latifolia TaxID=37657 RepID=UPI003D77BC4E
MGGAAHALKRIPRIKFPQRHPPKPQGTSPSTQDDGLKAFLSKSISGNSTLSASGKASDQPKRTPLSNEEIEAVLLGGCF